MEQYPVFDPEYIKEVSTENTRFFKQFLAYTNALVNNFQRRSEKSAEIPLTFYPIAKNIRTVTSFMAKHVMDETSSFMDNLARRGEARYWKKQNDMEWYPWLWSRGRMETEDYTNQEGWNYYFDSFKTTDEYLLVSQNRICPPGENVIFFIYLSCCKYVFRFSAQFKDMMQKYKAEMQWPENGKVLAVQIRRGDTVKKDGSMAGRPYFELNDYIEKMDIMIAENGFEYIYISTDSNEEIREVQKLRPEWKLLQLPIDRSQFLRVDETMDLYGKQMDLEVFCAMHPDRIPFIMDSGMADLYFISQCQGYISTISISEFSLCGWLLQMAEQEKLTPYINMTGEEINVRKKLLLL
jgi:hypothetical protein